MHSHLHFSVFRIAPLYSHLHLRLRFSRIFNFMEICKCKCKFNANANAIFKWPHPWSTTSSRSANKDDKQTTNHTLHKWAGNVELTYDYSYREAVMTAVSESFCFRFVSFNKQAHMPCSIKMWQNFQWTAYR